MVSATASDGAILRKQLRADRRNHIHGCASGAFYSPRKLFALSGIAKTGHLLVPCFPAPKSRGSYTTSWLCGGTNQVACTRPFHNRQGHASCRLFPIYADLGFFPKAC